MNPVETPLFARRSFLPLFFEIPVAFLARRFYRVATSGAEGVPSEGGVLLLANHISYVDPVVIHLACRRPLRFVADSWLCRFWLLRWVFELAGTIIADPSQPKRWMRDVRLALERGEAVCLFPEAGISRTGQLMALRSTFMRIVEGLEGCRIVPVAHDGLWGSVFSFSGNRLLFKSPRLKPTEVRVHFGAPLLASEATPLRLRRELLDLGAAAFHQRPVLERHLATEVVRALAKRPFLVRVVDRTATRREVKGYELLVGAILLSQHLRKHVAGRRVGVVLPPGAGAVIANLAVLLAGKIPVNLNFTAGNSALSASFRQAEITTVVSAQGVRDKLPDFPWPDQVVDLRKVLLAAPRSTRLLWAIAVALFPNQWLPRLLSLPKTGGDQEAALLFTSGSSGDPKGVPLSHRNLLANCWQISSLTILPESRSILGCLPVFHSFGFTVTLWYPLLRGCLLVTVPSPLETRRMIEAIHEEEVSVLVAAPTFLRPILKRARSSELKSLSLVVCGAERLPADLEEGFRDDFHISIMQGYGMTETTPVASVNQGDPPRDHAWSLPQVGRRSGSVGRLLPGMACRIRNPDTGDDMPENERGLLYLRGANLFAGYLNDPERTRGVMQDGWYNTGDLARFDAEGFLFVEGRLSRFSKIGGEMVPHGTIEDWLKEHFQPSETEETVLAVVGVPDSVKGEALVVVAACDLDLDLVREQMLAAGFASLWVPRRIVRTEVFPRLATGKTDYRSCARLAQGAAIA